MRNTMKKMMGVLLAAIMVLAMSITAFAATNGTITITPPANFSDDAVYKIYKVFDAAGNGDGAISYKLVPGKTGVPAGFTKDSAGNVTYTGTGTQGQLTAADIAAIADYVTDDDLVATVEKNSEGKYVSPTLPNGYYYIATSTGTVVTIDSTNPNATVNDKNEVPSVDKKITGASSVDEDGKKALAQIGTNVDYEATIAVKKGAEGYVFHDKMDDSALAYNNDVKVYVDGQEVAEAKGTFDTTTLQGDTITITFADSYVSTLAGKNIVVKYSAKITADAVTAKENTAKISYGNDSKYDSNESKTEVYNATIKVVKYDGAKSETDPKYLAGAGFVLKNADGKYYSYSADTGVVWKDAYAETDIHTTNETDGSLDTNFIGLPNGTYTLEEVVVPDGYNKAADETVTIDEHDYTADNLVQSKDVINQQGAVLPATGGMGTTMFYVIGALLVLGAGVVLIARKRTQNI